MEKKSWNNPEICSLDIENTQYGGNELDEHDGPVYQNQFWPHGS
jgi:hypothetical protein